MPRAPYGVLAFLPIVGVISAAVWTTAITSERPDRSFALGPVAIDVPALTVDELIPIAIVIVATAVVQIGTAIPFILHAHRNASLEPGRRLAWFLLMLFVGSIAQPVYWASHVRGGRPGPAR